MNKDELLERIEELKKALEQSAANHNSLIGRLSESQFLLEKLLQPENQEC